jgi:zinc/manganese transport system substrate-binding protein
MSLLTLFLAGPLHADELTVVTTVPDLAWVVTEVGGDRVDVKTICKGYQDPHYLEAKPSYTKYLRKAGLLVYVGLELEVAWLPMLLKTARNPDLLPGSTGLLEAASAVDRILEVPTQAVDRSQGDIHPFGNPHILLDPENLVPIARSVATALTTLDPGGAETYQERLKDFQEAMDARIRVWTERAAELRGSKVVAYHKQWEYLVAWLGLEILDYVENRPGVPPSPRHVNTLIQRMKDEHVRMVLAATFVDIHAAEEVARRGEAKLVVLPAAVGGTDRADTYPELIDTILESLIEAAP